MLLLMAEFVCAALGVKLAVVFVEKIDNYRELGQHPC